MSKTIEKINLQPSHIRVYRYVEKYMAAKIVAPDVIEIAAGVKLTSRQTHRLVDELCTLGYLSKEKYKKRSIKVERPLK